MDAFSDDEDFSGTPIDETPVPMDAPATATWGQAVSDADIEKIKAGFVGPDMDYRWVIITERVNENGDLSVWIGRSWTRQECYILDIRTNKNGHRIESITWEQNKGGIYISEEQSKKESIILCRVYLGCDFDMLPDYGQVLKEWEWIGVNSWETRQRQLLRDEAFLLYARL
ncbi:hypothetical protein ANO11243_085130 [Dothideomycetidae sp. 11243]|nr:hypothetical protein ANO11243_085130 [fungal sp. No.11243]